MTMPKKQADRIAVENVNHPGGLQRVDRAKYEAMRGAYLRAAPKSPPGLTIAEIHRGSWPTSPRLSFPAAPRRAGGRKPSARPRGEGSLRADQGSRPVVALRREAAKRRDPPPASLRHIDGDRRLDLNQGGGGVCRLSWRNVETITTAPYDGGLEVGRDRRGRRALPRLPVQADARWLAECGDRRADRCPAHHWRAWNPGTSWPASARAGSG